ncbi:MAG: NUDIX domain-containing protein [Candidatus Sungbacteria bacterium]|nr:NUDIX domain-containing protein [Candidatus Sungbacteria bacterium]
MGEEEIARGEIVIASAGMLFYRRRLGEIEVLTAIRQNEPWAGCTTVDFGGLVKPSDRNVAWAAIREGGEETGGKLQFHGLRLVGDYGPQNFWHKLKRQGQDLIAIPTETPISGKYHFVHLIYAAEVFAGEPAENPEMLYFRWAKPLDLADEGCMFAFEGALVLAEFWHKIRNHPSWGRDPEVASWIVTPRD